MDREPVGVDVEAEAGVQAMDTVDVVEVEVCIAL